MNYAVSTQDGPMGLGGEGEGNVRGKLWYQRISELCCKYPRWSHGVGGRGGGQCEREIVVPEDK